MNVCLRIGLACMAALSVACTTLPLDHEFQPVMPTVMTTDVAAMK